MQRSSGTRSRAIAGSAALMLVVVASTLVGCRDVAQPKYSECVAAEAQGDILAAAEACEAAVKADATSKSGKAAADKLKGMPPAVVKAKKDKVARLRDKVKRRYFDEEPDGECTGKSLPPFRWKYEGGTYAEDDDVALADGCTKLHKFSPEIRDYCCPKRPMAY